MKNKKTALQERWKELANISESKRSTTLKNSSLLETHKGADGRTYGIIKESSKYFIKSSSSQKENLNESDFAYIGGLENKLEHRYDHLTEAQRILNSKLRAIKEQFNTKFVGKINESEDVEVDVEEEGPVDEGKIPPQFEKFVKGKKKDKDDDDDKEDDDKEEKEEIDEGEDLDEMKKVGGLSGEKQNSGNKDNAGGPTVSKIEEQLPQEEEPVSQEAPVDAPAPDQVPQPEDMVGDEQPPAEAPAAPVDDVAPEAPVDEVPPAPVDDEAPVDTEEVPDEEGTEEGGEEIENQILKHIGKAGQLANTNELSPEFAKQAISQLLGYFSGELKEMDPDAKKELIVKLKKGKKDDDGEEEFVDDTISVEDNGEGDLGEAKDATTPFTQFINEMGLSYDSSSDELANAISTYKNECAMGDKEDDYDGMKQYINSGIVEALKDTMTVNDFEDLGGNLGGFEEVGDMSQLEEANCSECGDKMVSEDDTERGAKIGELLAAHIGELNSQGAIDKFQKELESMDDETLNKMYTDLDMDEMKKVGGLSGPDQNAGNPDQSGGPDTGKIEEMSEQEKKVRSYVRMKLEEKLGLRKSVIKEGKKNATQSKLDKLIDSVLEEEKISVKKSITEAPQKEDPYMDRGTPKTTKGYDPHYREYGGDPQADQYRTTFQKHTNDLENDAKGMGLNYFQQWGSQINGPYNLIPKITVKPSPDRRYDNYVSLLFGSEPNEQTGQRGREVFGITHSGNPGENVSVWTSGSENAIDKKTFYDILNLTQRALSLGQVNNEQQVLDNISKQIRNKIQLVKGQPNNG